VRPPRGVRCSLPCRVFLRLMGLPLSDLDIFLAVKDEIIRPPGLTMEEQAPHRKAAGETVYAYFDAEVKSAALSRLRTTCSGRSWRKRSTGSSSRRGSARHLLLVIIAGLDT